MSLKKIYKIQTLDEFPALYIFDELYCSGMEFFYEKRGQK